VNGAASEFSPETPHQLHQGKLQVSPRYPTILARVPPYAEGYKRCYHGRQWLDLDKSNQVSRRRSAAAAQTTTLREPRQLEEP
jgi:hypothetical protein